MSLSAPPCMLSAPAPPLSVSLPAPPYKCHRCPERAPLSVSLPGEATERIVQLAAGNSVVVAVGRFRRTGASIPVYSRFSTLAISSIRERQPFRSGPVSVQHVFAPAVRPPTSAASFRRRRYRYHSGRPWYWPRGRHRAVVVAVPRPANRQMSRRTPNIDVAVYYLQRSGRRGRRYLMASDAVLADGVNDRCRTVAAGHVDVAIATTTSVIAGFTDDRVSPLQPKDQSLLEAPVNLSSPVPFPRRMNCLRSTERLTSSRRLASLIGRGLRCSRQPSEYRV